MQNLIARLREPSSWAAIATMAAIAGHPVPGDVLSAIPQIIGGIGSLLAFFMPEKR